MYVKYSLVICSCRNDWEQKKLLLGKGNRERPCFTLATMMRKLFIVIERSFWPEGRNKEFSGSLCPRGLNLIFYCFLQCQERPFNLHQVVSSSLLPRLNRVFLYLPFLATISFVSQSFLHQQITNEYLHTWYHLFVAVKLKQQWIFFIWAFLIVMWNSLFNIVICYFCYLFSRQWTLFAPCVYCT